MFRWKSLAFAVLLAGAPGLALPADPIDIQTLREQVRLGESSGKLHQLEIAYHGVGSHPKGLPRWSAWMSHPELHVQTTAAWHDHQRDARVFLRGREVVSVRSRTGHPSDRWSVDFHAIYRADGTLAYQETRVETQDFFCNDPRGPQRGQTRLQVREEASYSPEGEMVEFKRVVLGYEALPESAVSYHPCKIPGYLSIAKLPFFPVIDLALKRLP